jgi:hypothetical protein
MEKNKQLFFSHTWRPDNIGRNTHDRVFEMVKKLRDNGWTTWFDEEDMGGNIDAAMAEGIENADAILVCLTETYCKKVNETAKNPRNRDNCLKEWTYANMRNKLLIPVIMEPCLLNTNNWPPGIVSLYLGSTLYINASNDDISEAVIFANSFLLKHGLQPHNKTQNLFITGVKKLNIKKESPISPKSSPKSSPKPLTKSLTKPLTKSLTKPSTKSLTKPSTKSSPKLPRPPSKICPRFKGRQNIFRKHRSPPPPPQPPPSTPLPQSNKTIEKINNINEIASKKSHIKPNLKSIDLMNRRISENNVFSSYISNKTMKKSKSTGDYINLCI